MLKVKNKKVLYRLSEKTLMAKGKKNLVAILAIVLTTVLFTTLFTIGGGMVNNFQEATMRQVGGKSMAGIKFVLPKDYEKLTKDSKVKNPSYRILVGQLANEEITKLSTEVNFAEDENAKSMFCYPEVGNMPKERLEVVTSTQVLDALKIPHKVGEQVTLEIIVDGKMYTETFTLSGYWEGDEVSISQQCFVSREYCDEVAPEPEKSFYEGPGSEYAGYWMVDFDYSNSWDIEEKTIQLLERTGYDKNKISYGVNWAYVTGKTDGGTIGFLVALLGLILTSGYLIIYNIFSLNVASDIKSYGLLKTIGTTEKQLKKLVRQQAVFLSAMGIPCGLILGAVLGKCLFPVIVKNFELKGVEFSIHPLVMVGAAVFSFFTVWISCNKPCKLAAKVSPIEAVRYTDKSTCDSKKERKSRKLTTFSFAWANMGRNRKKVVVVVASLSLSMILFNSVYTIIKGFDMDKYVSVYMIGDVLVTDAGGLKPSSNVRNYSSVTQDIQEELKSMKGIKELHSIYLTETDIEISETAKKNFLKFTEEMPEIFADTYMQQELENVRENKIPWGKIYGVDKWGMEQLECYKGELDWEKFNTGNYCLVNTYGIAWEMEEALTGMYCDVGDKVSVELSDGSKKEYEVMAVASLPHALSARSQTILAMEMILPETEYLAHGNGSGAMLSVLMQEENTGALTDKILENYTEQVHPELDFVSKTTYEKEFKDFVNTFWIVGGALSLVLALIGILNFINAVVTGILARKQELAMMEAVGMTGKQMKFMLAWEGGVYAVFTMIFSIVGGKIINSLVLENALTDMWYFTNQFTIVPIILCMPVLLLLACVIPMVAYKNMNRESVVERLRQVD